MGVLIYLANPPLWFKMVERYGQTWLPCLRLVTE